MKKALIITSFIDGIEKLNNTQFLTSFEFCIAADGGYVNARRLGLTPDTIIGDFDSAAIPDIDDSKLIKLPSEKDMTDSEAAIDLAVAKEYSNITVVGGLGGRFDHTMANLSVLAKYAGKLQHLAFFDAYNYVYMLTPGKYTIHKQIQGIDYKYLGVHSFSKLTSGIHIKGCKYPLVDFSLSNDTTLGTSNEILNETAEISFTQGQLIITHSCD